MSADPGTERPEQLAAERGGRRPVARALLAAVAFYQRAISPAFPPRCRFQPTCSAYAAEAIAVHGAGRGTWLALRRLLKCAPWHPGGLDLVPPRTSPPGTVRPVPSAPRRAPQEESPVA
ncbi:membrane protein insertion efficiency factor YidD [Geodermatophilus sp. SYSU D01176]